LLLAVLEKMVHALFVEGVGTKLAVVKPLIQMRDQPQLLLGCGVSVPLLGESPGKPGDVEL